LQTGIHNVAYYIIPPETAHLIYWFEDLTLLVTYPIVAQDEKMSPEMLLVVGTVLLVMMFLFDKVFPRRVDPCQGQPPPVRAHVSKILDKLEAILDKIETDLHQNGIEDAAIETRIDTLLHLTERGLCEQYALWSQSIERDIERTSRDYHLADSRVWKPAEIETILDRLEGIMAPLASPTIT
jgi:hypothetical protein